MTTMQKTIDMGILLWVVQTSAYNFTGFSERDLVIKANN